MFPLETVMMQFQFPQETGFVPFFTLYTMWYSYSWKLFSIPNQTHIIITKFQISFTHKKLLYKGKQNMKIYMNKGTLYF